MQGSDFKPISHRGRLAFIICCVENVLFHSDLTHPRWSVLLELLWKGTEDNYFYLEEYFASKNPEVLNKYSNWSDYYYAYQNAIDLPGVVSSEIEFNELKTIYGQSPMINQLLELILVFAADPLYGAIDDQYNIGSMDQIIQLMEANSVALPDLEDFKFAVSKTYDQVTYLGAPFRRSDVFKHKL